MPHPGPDPKFDYTDAPYQTDWKPADGREWAIKYCKSLPGDRDDEHGFQEELRMQIPGIYRGHATPSWVPLVDYFVRHDRKGVRQDLNLKLRGMEKPKAIEDRQKADKEAKVMKEWEAAHAAVADTPPANTGSPTEQETAPTPSATETPQNEPLSEGSNVQQRNVQVRREVRKALQENRE